ncbi:RagB/SusD family nutrient uptake outer membrane protein [Spirosoma endbachense]|uniref:RagB/SusD family nutrient uptake outer membrane protein n=1 Tax=Spirosoma endbachense TaxID=2666025 RepID=A0A6P1W6W5_9BACT|nr:RagB/SusD family nutrient uptake outer membrane protein [Spirosoma endbachense]QHW00103.1 RagB/SusD family nutrient uptake outer membrane protein [Spirosoma endbachense]
MKKYILSFAILFSLTTGCKDDSEFLNIKSTSILLVDEVYSDPRLVLSAVTDLYNRIPDFQEPGTGTISIYAVLDEAFSSGDYPRHQTREYDYVFPGINNPEVTYWDYSYIREINLFIERVNAATKLSAADKARFVAEGRFLRANVYFELVRRLGGVPLITESLTYDYSGNAAYLRKPRAKESEIYDYVISELEAIKSILPKTPNEKSRATYGLALAAKSRAALYAGSIAKYGVNTPTVTLPGGEVGIPVAKATGYYQTALDAAQELITSGQYSLYQKAPDLSTNFANIFLDKANNPEVIFVEDYKLQSGKVHSFALDNQPRAVTEEGERGGRLNPSLNLVQSFEKLDNTFAPLPINKGAATDYIYYDKPEDLFAGRDARLRGTVLVPGDLFKNRSIDIFAGLILGNGSTLSGDQLGQLKMVNGASVQVVGLSGPIEGYDGSAQSGFYMRKYNDPVTGSGQIGTMSEVWNVRYRYAEVLLNAAEAAFELGQTAIAAGYMKQVRDRAGLTKALTPSEITFDRIVHERKVELSFENHILWDMKRWRLAHVVWDGSNSDLTTLPGKATEPSTRVYSLWPYKIYDPGGPNHNKWVYRKVLSGRVTQSHIFRLGNYYARINDGIINNNPLILRNPNQ